MPADEERQVDDHLSHLRSDVDQVDWSDAAAVRRRGQQRGRQQAAAGTLAVVLSVGVLGVAATGRFPGQDGQSPLITASQDKQSESADAKQGSGTSATRDGEGDSKDGGNPRTGDSTHDDGDNSPGKSKSPSATQTASSPTGSVTPKPTTPGSEPPGPTNPAPTDTSTPPGPPELTFAALLTTDEMPTVNESTVDTWSENGTATSEGTSASVCASGTLASLGASTTVRRDYLWGAAGSTVLGDNVVGVFPSGEDAGKAFDSYAGWVESCSWADSPVSGPTEVTVDGGTARWWWAAKKATSDSTGEVEVVGLVRRGTAVSVVVWHQDGQDFSYPADPMAATLQDSAVHLQPFGS